MTDVYIVRHAKAGDRARWDGDDELRPLTKAGQQQAAGLVEALAERGVAKIVSSHYVRCTQTVEPLATATGIGVETHDALAEGAHPADTTALILAAAAPTVLCTHGDVIESMLLVLIESKVPGVHAPKLKKGSTWALQVADGAIEKATYIPPR